jgi:FixJ family two-component response regulator
MRTEKRVCIIDDDEAIREALNLLLFAAGISALTFGSADQFLARSGGDEFDCMLLDIRMPGTDGFALFQMLLREKVPYPIIFITGHGDIPLAVSAIKQGAFDFLTKPFQQGELLAKVKAAIAHYRDERKKLHSIHELNRRSNSCTPRERDVMRLLACPTRALPKSCASVREPLKFIAPT